MKIKKTREMLEDDLRSIISLAAKTINKNDIKNIVEHLNEKHGIKKANINMLFNNANNVGRLSDAELALIGQQIVHQVGINPTEWMEEWFTEREIKEFERFQFVDLANEDEIDFPLELNNVMELGNGYYNATMDRTTLARLYKYGKLNYNPNVQRGMKIVQRYGKSMEEPILYKNKVTQLKKLILNDELEPSTITLNAAQMSSDTGIELEYDKSKNKLIIHAGTILDIVDGMHRTVATYSAYSQDKDIKGAYPITISNKSDEEVQKYQVNMDKHTPLPKGRILEYTGDMVTNVIDVLKSKGDLSGKIATSIDAKSALTGDYLVTYKALHLAIGDVYGKIDSIFQARQIANDINEYMLYLFGYFGGNTRTDFKVMFDSDVFIGHIYLCKLMKDKGVSYESLGNILTLNEFNKDNPFWKETGVYGNDKRAINKKNRERIKKFFANMLVEE